MFEPEMPSDFVWLDMWSSDETKASDSEIWNSTNLGKSCRDGNNSWYRIDGVSVRD